VTTSQEPYLEKCLFVNKQTQVIFILSIISLSNYCIIRLKDAAISVDPPASANVPSFGFLSS